MPIWLLVVMSAAAYRITRLIVKDDLPLIAKPREWLTDRGPDWWSELLSCHWCASGWVSLGIVAGTDWRRSVPLPLFVWWAVWAFAAVAAHYERDDPNITMHGARVILDQGDKS